jgi:ABC-type transporter Mla MlaB component
MPLVPLDDRCLMLKITVLDGGAEKRLLVEGKVAEPWVSELELAWNRTQQTSPSSRILVDLSGVTRIDTKGEAVLVAMVAQGAQPSAKGVYWEYVVKHLMNEARKLRGWRHRHGGDGGRDSTSAKESSQRAECPRSQDLGGPEFAK